MPAKSEKQAKLFRLVRGLQKGEINPRKVTHTVRKMAKTIKPNSVKHFTKVKEIMNSLKETEYSVSKVKKVDGKSLKQLTSENAGHEFDKKELQTFQSKQSNFAGVGKTTFLLNKSTNEMTAELFSNGSTKKFVFKKLKDKEDGNIFKYACFIQKTYPEGKDKELLYTLSNNFDDKDVSEKIKVLGDFINRIDS